MKRFRPRPFWLKGRESRHHLQINRENYIKMVPIPPAIKNAVVGTGFAVRSAPGDIPLVPLDGNRGAGHRVEGACRVEREI